MGIANLLKAFFATPVDRKEQPPPRKQQSAPKPKPAPPTRSVPRTAASPARQFETRREAEARRRLEEITQEQERAAMVNFAKGTTGRHKKYKKWQEQQDTRR